MLKLKVKKLGSRVSLQKNIRQRQGRNRRRGQTLIEMALAVPILLLLVLGIMQYGIINNATISLTQLSREGARFGSVHANDTGPDPYTGTNDDPDSKIKNHLKQVAASTPIDYNDIANSITITPPIGQRNAGGDLTVAFSYPLSKKFFIPASFPGLSQLNSYAVTCTMVIEQ